MTAPKIAHFDRANPKEGQAQLVVAFKSSKGASVQLRVNVCESVAHDLLRQAITASRNLPATEA